MGNKETVVTIESLVIQGGKNVTQMCIISPLARAIGDVAKPLAMLGFGTLMVKQQTQRRLLNAHQPIGIQPPLYRT